MRYKNRGGRAATCQTARRCTTPQMLSICSRMLGTSTATSVSEGKKGAMKTTGKSPFTRKMAQIGSPQPQLSLLYRHAPIIAQHSTA